MKHLTADQLDALNDYHGYPRLLNAQHMLNEAVAAQSKTRADIASGVFRADYTAQAVDSVTDKELTAAEDAAIEWTNREYERCVGALTNAAIAWAIHRDNLARESGVTAEQLDWIEQAARDFCRGNIRDFRLAPLVRRLQQAESE